MENIITLAQRVNFTKYGLVEKTVDEVIDIIQSGEIRLNDPEYGEYTLKDITAAIRSKSDPKIQNELKAQFLPVVTFNGIWNGEMISAYSNITALDFDHISTDEQLTEAVSALKSSPCVLAIFRTFKPRQIKALVLHDNPDPARHKEMYEQLITEFGHYGIDESCKDLSRKTYLPWDEGVWINHNCIPYHFIPSLVPTKKSAISTGGYGKSKSPQSIINILNSSWQKKHPEYWQRGYRASSIFKCACQLCLYGVPQDLAEDYFLNGGWIANDFEKDEIFKHVKGAYLYNKDQYGSKDFI